METQAGREEEILSEAGVTVRRKDMKTMSPGKWLNDTIIDAYMALIEQRGRRDELLPTTVITSVHFYSALRRRDKSSYSELDTWVGEDIMKRKLLVFPIYWSHHYSLVVVDTDTCIINYLDSMKGSRKNSPIPEHIKIFLEEYCRTRKIKKTFKVKRRNDVPIQGNGSDCGPFICVYAEKLTAKEKCTFSQQEMENIRLQMVDNLLQGKIQRWKQHGIKSRGLPGKTYMNSGDELPTTNSRVNKGWKSRNKEATEKT